MAVAIQKGAVQEMALLDVKNVKKIYTARLGAVKVQALNDGGICGDYGRVRVRKDDSVKHFGFSG